MVDLLKIMPKRQRLSSLLGLALDGSRLDGVVLRRTNGSLQVQQSFSVGQGSQTINFLSSPPPQPSVGAPPYPVVANGGNSGNPVTFSTSTFGVCASLGTNGSTITFTTNGTCVIIANQAGDANFLPAPTAQQSFAVKTAQSINFTSPPPNPALYLGPMYAPTANGGASGNAVTFSSATPLVCTYSAPNVSFVGTGTCTINADQAGNANFYAAPTAQQSFPVVPNASPDAYNALGNVLVNSATGTPFK